MRLPKKQTIIRAIPKPIRAFARATVLPLLPSELGRRIEDAVSFSRPGSRAATSDASLRNRNLQGHSVRSLERKLWRGRSEYALEKLLDIQANPSSLLLSVRSASEVLACWYLSWADFESAQRHAATMRLASGEQTSKKQLTLEAEVLFSLGKFSWAHDIVQRGLVEFPEAPEFLFLLANSHRFDTKLPEAERDELRLEAINKVFATAGLSRITKADPARPLRMDNLKSAGAKQADAGLPKLSVLIPAFNCEDTLEFVLEMLLAQTWTNLEIVVVDDCSTDRCYDVALRFAQRDGRVKCVKQTENCGTYVARNTALHNATGEFVVVHDTDDWSHPQRMEIQVRHLLENPQCIANVTQWVRCTEDLVFRPPTRVTGEYVHLNSSSLMMQRERLLALGGWDEVRVGGDTELIRRLQASHGNPLPRLHAQIPLAFGMERPTSLTRQSATHVFTRVHGIRCTYQESAEHWRRTHSEQLPALPGAGERAFPAPGLILPKRMPTTELDLLFVMDFALQGGAYVSTFNYMQAAVQLGLRVGALHVRRDDLSDSTHPNDHFMRAAHSGEIVRVSPGESVRAPTVIVGYPVILRSGFDLPPRVECDRVIIVVNQMSARLYSGEDVQYDPLIVSENCRRMFGKTPEWVPISDLVRSLMRNDGRYASVRTETWTPLIDAADWLKAPRGWRRADRKRPIVGRHARDQYTKWPTSSTALRDAYCADRNCDVYLMGGASIPRTILGTLPENWKVFPFGEMDPQAFLDQLDFYVHYPHEDYIEEFGRAVLEAMAAGVPVVLPPVFQATFGEAALYREPGDVWPTIQELWNDERGWMARVEVGRSFVSARCDWARFAERLALLGS